MTLTMTQDAIYKIFAKFVVANPNADLETVLRHVLPESRFYGDVQTISIWYSQWRVVWTELAL